MPRDASRTRELLIDAGRDLFASDGVYSVALARIVERAGQKNESALHYHFGGRDGLLTAIIGLHNVTIEARRREMLDAMASAPTLSDLVSAYILPQADLLDSKVGRQFLSIVSQLDDWRAPATPDEAGRALAAIVDQLDAGLTDAIRHERITRFLGLVAEALGARARALDRGNASTISDAEFVENLMAMSVGALSAPAPGRDRRSPPARAESR